MALFGTTPTPPSRLEDLKRILQRDPTSRQFLALADEYRRHGKVREAIVTLERGLSIHTTSVAAYVSLGRAYQQIERPEEAIRAYHNALRYDRENLVAIRQLADVHLARGDKLEALKKFKLYQGLKSGEKDVQEAIERIEGELEPSRVRTYPSSGSRPIRPDRLARPAPAAATAPASREPLPPKPVAPAEITAPFEMPAAPVWTQDQDIFAAEPPEVPSRVPSTLASPAFLETELSAPESEQTAPIEILPEPQGEIPGVPPVETVMFDVPVRGGVPPASPRTALREPVPEEDETAGASESPTAPLVTETLAELYHTQGYLAEAREVYLSLAESAEDSGSARLFAGKAEALRETGRHVVVRKRLEGLLAPFEPAPPLANEDLSALLRSLVATIPGLRSAALTDREGLAVLTEGVRAEGETLETLLAELTSFVKNVGRSNAEIGAGPLKSLAVVGEKGAAVLANVNADYALILESDPQAALGEVRWAAARAAERLRPAVG